MKAIVIHKQGGLNGLQLEDKPVPVPQAGEILVNNKAIGVNFVDTLHRSGTYPMQVPFTPGIEAAGIVEAVGPGTKLFSVGDKVGYAGFMGGNYAEYTAVPEQKAVPIPENVSFETAAASLLQGMTAHYLSQSIYPIQSGNSVLIHAAAGGVGLLLVQMVKQKGAIVIGTTSSEAKAKIARDMGADHMILYTQEDFHAETMRLTNNEGVHVVYDSVGKATFDKSILSLRARGYLVVYGISSGAMPPFDINSLSGFSGTKNKGSLFITRPSLGDYTSTRKDLLWRADDLFNWITNGTLKVNVVGTFPLSEAAKAHELMESRQVAGKIVLLP